MKTAVIYARYSSHHQREVSIDDQIAVCKAYCEREGLEVVRTYYDAAMTGTSDQRPDFQRMVSNAPESNYVVVYQMDRFSRDQYDAPLYKRELMMRGVKVLSATENIPDSPEGIFLEKLLEGQAAYYSMNLARSVKRGLRSNAERCMANGVKVFGYDIDETKHYTINEANAAIVREVFQRYTSGEGMKSIARDLASRGVRSYEGRPVEYSFVSTMLHNEKYTGVYIWDDVRIPGGMPQIIERSLFDMAQNATHRKIRANEEFVPYPLTGKLYCGLCGVAMHGESAHGRSGKYFYYACQRGRNCSQRNIRKELLEEAICATARAVVSDEGIAKEIAAAFVAQYGGGDITAALKANAHKLKENKRATTAIGDAIEKGIELPDVRERLERLKNERVALEAERGKLKAEDQGIDAETVVEFLTQGLGTLDDADILDGLVNRVYLFEDVAVAVLNIKGDSNDLAEVQIALDELEHGTCRFVLDWSGRPDRYINAPSLRYVRARVILLYNAIGIVFPRAA